MLEGEENLIKRAKKGDKECFGRLYDHYLNRIYRFIVLKVDSKAVAEDLVHEVFLSAFENINSYASRGFPFSSWLYQIARNKVIDYYRTRKNNLSFEMVSEEHFKIEDVIEKDLNHVLELTQVREAMRSLGEIEQEVLIMRFIEDMPHKEISRALGKSEGAIRLIQHRAINNLKQILQDDERGENN